MPFGCQPQGCLSDTPAWWVAQANTLAELRGWSRFAGLQIEYSLIQRTVEREPISTAKAFKLGLVAWSPLAGGVLSGKYHSGNADNRERIVTLVYGGMRNKILTG